MWKKKSEKGVVSLEACIVVPLFIFLMLFLYSFFVVFEARNEMGHLVLSTANSMSLDSYANEHLGNSGDLSQIIYGIYNLAFQDDTDFISTELWHLNPSIETEGGESQISPQLEEVIRKRFVAYLTDGNEENADALLKRYHIMGGLEGLDFSGSRVDNENLYIKVVYEMEYEFQVFGARKIKIEQSACSRIWKSGGEINLDFDSEVENTPGSSGGGFR